MITIQISFLFICASISSSFSFVPRQKARWLSAKSKMLPSQNHQSSSQELQKLQPQPQSCDTFVVMGDLTETGETIFGKNSDRPRGEVQDVVYIPGRNYPEPSKLQCTYIEIDQIVGQTYTCMLSKPNWMFGAEMGANINGVVIGNEAVWNRLIDVNEDMTPNKLLGMDFVRLGLERSSSALDAVHVITTLLEKYGQGGPCSNIVKDLSYHNSFLIADAKEAYVLETAAKEWVCEKITSGYRSISNIMSITTKVDLCSKTLHKRAIEEGWWDKSKNPEFNWKEVIKASESTDLSNPTQRYEGGCKLLQKLTTKLNDERFNVKDMYSICRNVESGINRPWNSDSKFPTAACQVSLLSKDTNKLSDIHWFTSTPSPGQSIFKPFLFDNDRSVTAATEANKDSSSIIGDSTRSPSPNQSHQLFDLHNLVISAHNYNIRDNVGNDQPTIDHNDKQQGNNQKILLLSNTQTQLENTYYDRGIQCRDRTNERDNGSGDQKNNMPHELFKEAVIKEMEFYTSFLEDQ